jgi:hypothetical protein
MNRALSLQQWRHSIPEIRLACGQVMRQLYYRDNDNDSRSVTVRVRFTRTLYAQLTCQKFHPPKPFHLPPRSAPAFRAAELGMKLASCRLSSYLHVS